MRADLTKLQVEHVLLNLRDAIGDDEQLRLDTLEGETDLFELTGRLLDHIENDEGDKAKLASQIDDRQARKVRCEGRIKAQREAIQMLMETAGVDKLPLPEATVSLRKVAPKLIVTDADALPDAFVSIVRKPDFAAIRAADCPVPGASLDNGGSSITIRRK